jgi:hypothetical protein
MLDEVDHLDADGWRKLRQIWNLGHQRGRQISLKVAGRRKLLDIYCRMLAAGVGSFLGETQQSRTFVLEMEPYTATTKPEREWSHKGSNTVEE